LIEGLLLERGILVSYATIRGSVRRVLQKPVQARGHGMLVKFDVTDLTKVARHDREGSYEGND
jgi:hypothetical protein